ncbi:MAG: hypothetical protein RMM98_02770 [Acidobacteriota bacterium]|nr:hypothetical protein [Blastocatellia bacterium]MDW8238514.1 hypothetical protein [Acidobacteriota bacterium]
MSAPQPSAQPVTEEGKSSLLKYHLTLVAFFILSWTAQYAGLNKYLSFVPEQIRGLLQALFSVLFLVNSGFYLSLVPLAMVFIFCWLYLMDTRVDLRKLYQIVVLSILPLAVLMLGLLVYTVVFMKVDPSVSQKLTEVFNTMLSNINQPTIDPATQAKMDELLRAKQQETASLTPFWIAAAICSCLICGRLLYRRLQLAAWKAFVIPVTFAVSIMLVRMVMNTGGGSVMDRVKQIVEP